MSHLKRLRPEAVAAPSSGILAVIQYAFGRDGLLPLWAGEGDLPTPDFIRAAAAEGLARGETFYTYQRGLPELRQALADYTQALYGQPQSPDRFFVTGSGMQAIQIALTALTGAGDEIVYFGPAWPNLPAAAALRGVKPVEVAFDPIAGGWQLDLDKVRDAIGEKTRALFVNTPANPTGWTATYQELEALRDMAREAGIAIIADEIYSQFFYVGERAPSFHDVMSEEDTIFFVNSFSKNWAMTGWRVGWIEAPVEFDEVIANLIQYSTSGVAAFMQRGAIAAIREGGAFVEEQTARAKIARDLFCNRLLATNRVALSPPDGAFYAFFSIDGIEDTRQAAFRIIDEANVGLAPGTAFGTAAPQFLRACFHRRLDEVEMAAERLADWIGAA
ncbi:MAG: pyridoxal phosphate-dependent aminotransferase [Fulvimarina manganoxydans]|uniref:pyridoxal phosphate-dependent aminotransferase n=1 Tax=Fulvimarina manganoxydans TaxID=937218 RepID=UPI002357A98A|nr:pyridoxal phosphate-dependent aminotransferase [Fulvimarina manganoxydans]MCK5934829.1 pyridoxal phosphate-dependent aminotransferase [Fulvimarina manganoxydans]